MVDAVHRLAPNIKHPNAPRGITVKFCRRIDMEEMRRKAIQKKGFSASNLGLSSMKTVYVNLAMSRETRILWAAVRRFKENNQYKFAWITSSGKIYLQKTEKGPAALIEDETDLIRLQPSKKQHQPTQSNDSCVSSMTLDGAEVEGSEEITKALAAYFKSVNDSSTLTLE
ncbi:hypothetical protein J6590_065923 [Homalodisca vitripennis]|nr:hypothetical protein J6590_065923 [Homalodisca vitripennis]